MPRYLETEHFTFRQDDDGTWWMYGTTLSTVEIHIEDGDAILWARNPVLEPFILAKEIVTAAKELAIVRYELNKMEREND